MQAMANPGKHSSRRTVAALLVGAVVAALLAYSRGRPGHVSLSPVRQTAPSQTGKARITKIVDGDTVHALLASDDGTPKGAEEKIRLFGINTPELHARPGTHKGDFAPEPFSQEACDYLASLCPAGSEVGLIPHGRDKYGRLLAVLQSPDGRDINRLLIEAGLAKAYFLSGSKKNPLRLEYERAEEEARAGKRGLWK